MVNKFSFKMFKTLVLTDFCIIILGNNPTVNVVLDRDTIVHLKMPIYRCMNFHKINISAFSLIFLWGYLEMITGSVYADEDKKCCVLMIFFSFYIDFSQKSFNFGENTLQIYKLYAPTVSSCQYRGPQQETHYKYTLQVPGATDWHELLQKYQERDNTLQL